MGDMSANSGRTQKIVYSGAHDFTDATVTGISAGGTPAGSDTQMQRNNAGAFGAVSGVTSDGTNMTAAADKLRATSPRILTSIFDANGLAILSLSPAASAVNNLGIANAATGANPALTATGSDTNISVVVTPKGTGGLWAGSDAFVAPPDLTAVLAGVSKPHATFASADSLKNNLIIWNADSGGSGAHNSAILTFLASGGTLAAPTNAVAGAGGAIYEAQYVGGAVAAWRKFTHYEFGNAGSNPAAETDVLGQHQFFSADGSGVIGQGSMFVCRASGVHSSNGVPFRAYNVGFVADGTGQNATDFEYGTLSWSGNVLSIGAVAGGTGTLRRVSLVGAQIAVPAGSVGAPSLVFGNDTTIGFYRVTSNTIGFAVAGDTAFKFDGNNGLTFRSDYQIGFASNTDFATDDLKLRRLSAGVLSIGLADNASPAAQGIAMTNASGTDTAGANLTITAGKSTGAGVGGSLIFRVTPAGASGSAAAATLDALVIGGTGKISFPQTVTAGGTTGDQTINKASGTVNIAAAGTTVTVTNSLCSTTSEIFAVLRTADATATIKNVVPGSGSFVINLGAAATAEVSIGWFIIN